MLAFGYQPERPEQLEIIREFLKSNQDDGFKYDHLVVEDDLPSGTALGVEFGAGERINMRDSINTLAEGLRAALSQGKRVVLVMPSTYSAQVISGNIGSQLVKNFKLPLTTISIVELLTNRDQEKTVSLQCLVTDAEQGGTGPLGCAILQASRSIYRKKMEAGKRPGMMDQRGISDYLVFY